ncbi:MAG: DUF4982 domain-containing protein, partial [bacterium]|nr:DUF4982 domain-containing protein [bacterium]
PVEVYTNCDSVELLLNGTSRGEQRVRDRNAPILFWTVPNEPGSLEAIGKVNDKPVARFSLHTAAAAEQIKLTPSRTEMEADGADLTTVEVLVVDANGTRVPSASNKITFTVEGAGELAAVDSPDPRDINPVQTDTRSAYQGRALAIVRAGEQAGDLVLKAASEGLDTGEVTLSVR